MALKKSTWLWILAGVVAFGIVMLMVLAGAGFYYVSKHVQAGQTTSAKALETFSEARAAFKDVEPIFELDEREDLRQIREFRELPTSKTRADMLWMLVWDPERQRLVKVSMPFWLLKLGREKVDINSGEGFDLQRLQLDVNELERVGPVLIFDFRHPNGKRVLVWTR
jgi:hypothetical protein